MKPRSRSPFTAMLIGVLTVTVCWQTQADVLDDFDKSFATIHAELVKSGVDETLAVKIATRTAARLARLPRTNSPGQATIPVTVLPSENQSNIDPGEEEKPVAPDNSISQTPSAIEKPVVVQVPNNNVAGTNSTASVTNSSVDKTATTTNVPPPRIVYATAEQAANQAISELVTSNKNVTYQRIISLAEKETNRLFTAKALVKSLDRATNAAFEAQQIKTNKTTRGGFKTNKNYIKLIKEQTNQIAIAARSMETLVGSNLFTPKAFLHIGYVTLNPFRFEPSTTTPGEYRLEDGSDSSIYVEFQYNNRWAWNRTAPDPGKPGELNWVNPFDLKSDFDLQARLGYSFVDSKTNEISSIVGGGNINGEFNFGRPFIKYQNEWLRYSMNLEVTYGAVSDHSDFDIHSTFIAGIGYNASVDSDMFPLPVLFSMHLGTGFVEVPDVTDMSSGTVSSSLNRPNFRNQWGVFGLMFETLLPLNRSTYVVAGGRLYANSNPNPWTAYIGISKELGSFRALTGLFSDKEK